MDMQVVWFGLVVALMTIFLFLEGFDFGVGILMPILSRNADERRAVVSAIGPFWDGNEVWLIASVAAMFAAFPSWYATVFSGFYPLMFLILVGLILRGVAFEFRNRGESGRWKAGWDAAIFGGSLLVPFLWGVMLFNFLRGVELDATGHMSGNYLALLNPYALLGGATLVSFCVLHGSIFLSLKTGEELETRSRKAAVVAWFPAVVLALVFGSVSFRGEKVFEASQLNVVPVAGGVLAALALAGVCVALSRYGFAFGLTGIALALLVATIFVGLYPRILVSSLNPEYSLTISNTAATRKSLEITGWLAVSLLPLIIGYQIWTYWIFRKRVTVNTVAYH